MATDGYVVVAKGLMRIPETGDWTIGVHSDDGFALRVAGAEFSSVHGAGQLDSINPSVMGFASGTDDSNTRGILRNLPAGVYPIEVITWDGIGNDFLEVYAAPGAYEQDSDTSEWRLIGEAPLQERFLVPSITSDGWTVKATQPGSGGTVDNLDTALTQIDQVTVSSTVDAINFNDPESDGANAGSIEGDQPFPTNTD